MYGYCVYMRDLGSHVQIMDEVWSDWILYPYGIDMWTWTHTHIVYREHCLKHFAC